MKKTKIAIVGGGAAGMIAAATICENNDSRYEVYLFEKNKKLGAKVIISGGGRCNVTTGIFRRKELLEHYTRGSEFLDYAFREFGSKKVRRWFEDRGVPLKEEKDKRIFPKSDDGKDVVGVFEKCFEDSRCNVQLGESVRNIYKADTGFEIVTTKRRYSVDKVVITTGGIAYRHTGSTGDGYTFAESMGHTITQLGPSLNSFVTQEKWLHACSGLSFPEAAFWYEGKRIPGKGPVLITHFGVSGPQTFVLASWIPFVELSKNSPCTIRLHIDHNKSYERRDERLKKSIIQLPKKRLVTLLNTQLPKRFVGGLMKYLGYSDAITLATMTKHERRTLSSVLGQGIPLTLLARKPGDEFVTAGGVSTDEINHKTMESKLCPGLYFAGEVMNVDGVTGGFNLQASRATGRLAGISINDSLILG